MLPTGLKAGYSEADVRQLTLCLTGWSISNDSTDRLDTGEFIYYSPWHDTSTKKVLGINIGASGQGEAQQVFDLLAVHPATARYVCTKLCRRLISDDPPASIVEQAAVVFNDQWLAADQLEQVVRAIILSSEFKDAANWGAKTRRPFELLAGAMRSCGGPAVKLVRPEPFEDYYVNLLLGKSHKFSQDLHWRMSEAGHMPFSWVTPDGFPDSSPAWLGSTPLIMGWRQINGLFMDRFPDDPVNHETSKCHEYYPVDAVNSPKNVLAVNERSAANIVDYWLRQILGYDSTSPGSPQIDPALRNSLVLFMQQDAAGPDTVLDFDAGDYSEVTWRTYVPQRLQALVASIIMLPENMLR